jgi:acylphosphatase
MNDHPGSVETISVHVSIEGRVQGVWYRGWTVDRARALGLRGWVRNRADGSVEAVFSGSTDAITAMERECWQGPPAARVTGVTSKRCAAPDTDIFETRATL